jgi:hypothetical protein
MAEGKPTAECSVVVHHDALPGWLPAYPLKLMCWQCGREIRGEFRWTCKECTDAD